MQWLDDGHQCRRIRIGRVERVVGRQWGVALRPQGQVHVDGTSPRAWLRYQDCLFREGQKQT